MRMFLWSLLAVCPLYAQSPSIVISEIMWMGSSLSSADEWVELYNAGDSTQALDGWTLTRLTSLGEEAMLTIEQGMIRPGETFLIANYAADHANSRLATVPDLVDASLSLPNSKLQLALYNGSPEFGGQLIDIADDGKGAPLAGDSAQKRSMERIDIWGDGRMESSWHTAETAYGWDPDSPEMGTPGLVPSHINPPTPMRPTAIQSTNWATIKAQ